MLHKQTYVEAHSDTVRLAMTETDYLFASSSLVTIDRTGDFSDFRPIDTTDASLTRQLVEAREAGIVHADTLYVPTAYSGIAVADALRGVYSALRLPEPSMAYVDPGPHDDWMDRYQGWRATMSVAGLSEVERLQDELAGQELTDIVVVEQFSRTGRTAIHAARIIDMAVPDPKVTISIIRGDWYGDILPLDIDMLEYGDGRDEVAKRTIVDLEQVTVPQCSDIMLEIGRECGRKVRRIERGKVT